MRRLWLVVTVLLLSSCSGYHSYTAVDPICTVGPIQINAVSSSWMDADQEVEIIVNGKRVARTYVSQREDWDSLIGALPAHAGRTK